jgi:O-antigen/teichoic acid export membrane protein
VGETAPLDLDRHPWRCHKLAHMQAAGKRVDASVGGAEPAREASAPGSPSAYGSRAVGHQSIWRRVRRDVVLLGAGSMGTVLAQLVFRSILITVLVPAAYGRLTLILSIYNTVWIIGAGGLPSGVARYIAAIAPADDSAIVRSALRAGAWPAVAAASFVAAISAAILNSPLAFLYGAIGLSSFVYAVIIMGILRGRGRIGSSSAIMPIGGIGEVVVLLVLVVAGLGVTPVSAFGAFCLGNVIGLAVGIQLMVRTTPREAPDAEASAQNVRITIPSTRELLGFSMWLGAATVGIAVLPVTVRLAAALSSYTVVAMVDVALVLLSIPLRIGSVIVSAVVPHATRALTKGDKSITISRREQLIVIAPFVLGSAVVAFTHIVGWLFDSLGRPEYAKGAIYLALALLAGPARVLYGLVEGVLVAHGEGRFLALNSLSVAAAASAAIVVVAALGSMVTAFALFVVACWAVYLCGLKRIRRLAAGSSQAVATEILAG